MWLGARESSGEILLFADADVRYHPHCLREAVAFLESRRVDFLALLPRMEAEGFWENVLLPYIIGAFFAGPGILANLDRPRSPWRSGARRSRSWRVLSSLLLSAIRSGRPSLTL